MSQPSFEITEDRTDEFLKTIAAFKRDRVLVGIPEEDSQRKESGTGVIGNAALLFINNFGSPYNNIPARPVMEIGIRGAQDLIAAEFKQAVQMSWTKGLSGLAVYYERVGIIASNSVKRAINDQIDIEPPSEATLESRERAGFKGTKALVVTGQLRNSITYVVQAGI